MALAIPTTQLIITRPAIQGVVALTTQQLVVVGIASDHIIAKSAFHLLNAQQTQRVSVTWSLPFKITGR